MVELFANSGDPDQTPRSAASDLGLHCLPINLLGVSRLKCVNQNIDIFLYIDIDAFSANFRTQQEFLELWSFFLTSFQSK